MMVDKSQSRTNPFYAIKHEYFPLPETVMPWAPTFSPDGIHILFHDYNGGKEWIMDSDGRNLQCITGNMKDRPDFIGGFYYILPDEKRMFLSNELGDEAYILECEPNLYNAREYRFMRIDFSGDKVDNKPCLGRRTFHLAPDSEHLAYNLLRPDGLIMLLCKLVRKEDSYVAEDFFVLNPQGPLSADDVEIKHWENSGALSEFKSFADGGRSFLFVSESAGGNIDQYKCDFATGDITRLTFNDDWDEDGAVSSDGNMIVCASWRTMNQFNVLSQMPITPSFLCFYTGAVLAVNYVSSFPGFSCDLQPWLLSGCGDTETTRIGQPLAPFCGGESIVVNNLAGLPFWSPDSTKILLQERLLAPPSSIANERVKEKGCAPNRIAVATLCKDPTAPLTTVETEVGAWAMRLSDYHANTDFAGEHIFCGEKGGRAVLYIDGNLIRCNHKVEYNDFSRDGQYILNGFESVEGNPQDLVWRLDLTATDKSGQTAGKIKGNLHFVSKKPAPARNIPPMTVSGDIFSVWQGVTRHGLPDFGAKTVVFPKPSPLLLHTELTELEEAYRINVYVSADVYGDVRPVCGAKVEIIGQTETTDRDGKAVFEIDAGSNGKTIVNATAGDTFLPSFSELYL